MSYIKVNNDKVTPEIAEKLIKLCPFNAFEYHNGYLSINSLCKVCKICVNKGPKDVCEFVEEKKETIDKSAYRGILVYLEHHQNEIHPVSFELINKAKELAAITKEPVYALLIGSEVKSLAEETLAYGVDEVFVYDDVDFKEFNVEIYTNISEDFFKNFKNNIILFGGTPLGRSFAPRVAARLKTGLTADCTKLEIKNNGDLVQIRPAFGGNIMARIITPNNRPQLATVRYQTFALPEKEKPRGKITFLKTDTIKRETNIELLKKIISPKVEEITAAEVIVAVGRGFKTEKDLELINPLVKELNAFVGCTRPLVEKGWFDVKKQIGMSGRTVRPKLIINIGISGAVQYLEGMKEADLIISLNDDPNSKIFEISDYSFVGDLYTLLPELTKKIKEIRQV
ncbi:MAG: electron transfer flavoprotein subunit alpha/FixB family protein [Acholeplasmataceae bacterium]|nr:electron transfer flavoprotein subunit alpha/FixB family protein [Acholeplasmataceae bacterium]HHT39971.1 electron transfer flavoprotein subunit alpha/FixB family protein [Acholeplasmataceae bacterium]